MATVLPRVLTVNRVEVTAHLAGEIVRLEAEAIALLAVAAVAIVAVAEETVAGAVTVEEGEAADLAEEEAVPAAAARARNHSWAGSTRPRFFGAVARKGGPGVRVWRATRIPPSRNFLARKVFYGREPPIVMSSIRVIGWLTWLAARNWLTRLAVLSRG